MLTHRRNKSTFTLKQKWWTFIPFLIGSPTGLSQGYYHLTSFAKSLSSSKTSHTIYYVFAICMLGSCYNLNCWNEVRYVLHSGSLFQPVKSIKRYIQEETTLVTCRKLFDHHRNSWIFLLFLWGFSWHLFIMLLFLSQ